MEKVSDYKGIQSVEGICDVFRFTSGAPLSDPPVPLFIELPHGATELKHLHDLKPRVRQYTDDRYDDFFMVNTDQGSPEYAFYLAGALTDPTLVDRLGDRLNAAQRSRLREIQHRLDIVVLRSLLPRTIVDVNRQWVIDESVRKAANLTGTTASFIDDEADLTMLHELYDAYQQQARRGYAFACENGGFAFNLHTYAPISVSLVEGEYIVDTLHRAYRPEQFATYAYRPAVELITTPPDGSILAPPRLVEWVLAAYRAQDIEITCDDPYPLHPAATGYHHCERYPHRILSMEIRRDLLAESFEPFAIWPVSPTKLAHMTDPLVEGVAGFLSDSL